MATDIEIADKKMDLLTDFSNGEVTQEDLEKKLAKLNEQEMDAIPADLPKDIDLDLE